LKISRSTGPIDCTLLLMKKKKTTSIIFDVNKNEIGRFLSRETTIDSSDRIIDETEFSENGNPVRRLIYRYFESGDLSEQIEYDSLNQLLQRQELFKTRKVKL